MLPKFIRTTAHRLLPQRVVPRRLRFGLAKGAVANVNFRYDAAFYFGQHEPDLKQYYQHMLRPGMKCFDVGMYRGWDALTFAHLTGTSVVSFDGDEKCLEMTRDFIGPSNAKVTLVHSYVSDKGDGITIDDAAARYFEPDFIKIDVEGAEAKVLRGARITLSRKRPAMVIETHGVEVEAECETLLRNFGYRPIVVERSRGLFSEARSLDHNRWLVCRNNSV